MSDKFVGTFIVVSTILAVCFQQFGFDVTASSLGIFAIKIATFAVPSFLITLVLTGVNHG